MTNENNELTKLLCSIVHYDYRIRNSLLKLLSNKEQLLIKENNIDTINILKHCLYSEQSNSLSKIYVLGIGITITFTLIVLSFHNVYIASITILELLIVPIIVFFVVITVSIFRIRRKLNLARAFFQDSTSININLSDENKALIERKKELLLERIIVYKDFNPFMGTGIKVDSWSFTINLTKENDGLSQHVDLDFNEAELLEFIEENLNRLDFMSSEAFLINENSIEQKDIEIKEINNIVEYLLNCESLTDEFNFYKKFELFDFYNFEGITGYITVDKDDFLLYVETNIYYLPSVLSSLEESLNLLVKKKLSFSDYLDVVFRNMGTSSKAIKFYNIDNNNYNARIKGMLGNLTLSGRLKADKVKGVSNEPYPVFKNVMGRDSIGLFFENYMQYTKYRILIQKMEKTILYSIEVFLRERGIDTTEFSNRKTTILNQGIFVEDGNLSINNSAIGPNAKVSSKTK